MYSKGHTKHIEVRIHIKKSAATIPYRKLVLLEEISCKQKQGADTLEISLDMLQERSLA